MLEKFRTAVATQLSELSGVDKDLVLAAIDAPRNPEHGDLAVAVPRLRVKGNPAQLAKDWVEKFQSNDLITGTNSIGPFMNFTINKEILKKDTLSSVFDLKEKFGMNNSGAGKRVLADFSSPNIAKPFHAGHLRSTIIGNFIMNLHRANGYDTVCLNYLGDWGKQYGLLAVGFDKYGDEKQLEIDPIKHLYDVYVKINADADLNPEIHDMARAYFKRMEDGDAEALAIWKRFRDLSIKKYIETYEKLNIHFDVYSGESQIGPGMVKGEQLLKEKGITENIDGAIVLNLEKYKLGKAIIQKRDGTTLYLTRDIGAAIERFETYNYDRSLYIVSTQQDLHFKQLFKTLELLELPFHDRHAHISYGLVKGMSTRKGTVVFLNDIIEQTTEHMHEVMKKNEHKYAAIEDPEKVAETVAISAIIVQDLAAKRIKDYVFDWNRMTSFEGDTGPYLQYAHARLCSLQRKVPMEFDKNIDFSLLKEDEAFAIIDILARYPDIISSTMTTLEPCTVVQYALKLSHAVSAAWENLWVQNQPDDIAKARLLLYYCARMVLGNALRLLGLTPLEKM
ncbi:hypothetical protein BB560_006974 [Smittium megazygosporum]|uniref:arginine--tRNA ligase n=1 Tax=Smittium megazygosporum TaxID=133381 RepID=A0A2T9XZU2_9FUNG|nr:hypothetical protein BB560_006974 [Smittium megazygosporum]